MTDVPGREGPPSYSTAEVARRLGVSIPTIQRWVDLGHLKAWKTVGGHRRIEAESAERMFRSQGAVPLRQVRTVMLVDDNPDDRDVLAVLIETAMPGAKLTQHDNGFQALVSIGQSAPDILITDIVMPHMNGIEMLRQVATSCAVRPRTILAVSSQTRLQIAQLGGLPPGIELLAKPIEPDTVIAALRAAAAALDSAA